MLVPGSKFQYLNKNTVPFLQMKPPLMDRKMQTWVLLPVTCHPTLDSMSSIALRIPGGQVTILNDQECA